MHTPTFKDQPCSEPTAPQTEPSATSVGRMVHYVARGSADGRFPSVCRMAFVTETHPAERFLVGLAVVNPSGFFFYPLEMRGVAYGAGDLAEDAKGARCNQGDRAYPPGTWHLPERTS